MPKRFKAKPFPPQILLALGVLILLLIGAWMIYYQDASRPVVTDFESCVDAGNPVAESYPERCFHDGRGFVKEY